MSAREKKTKTTKIETVGDNEKENQAKRILEIYIRLCEGKIVNKSLDAKRYDVSERTIQRDIDNIRACLAELVAMELLGNRDIRYDRKKKSYIIKGNEYSIMSNSEILAVCKIILESRAFTKVEVNKILDVLIAGCTMNENEKLVRSLVANEKFHYVELNHQTILQDKLWDIGTAVDDCRRMEITYIKQDKSLGDTTRIVEPLAIIFSEYYFYLTANIVEFDKSGKCIPPKYNYPTIFRIDRINKYKICNEHFKVPYSDRFQDGELRKRIQFMYSGELLKVKLRYTGQSVEAILDRLPTARVVYEDNNYCDIEAEVYGKGIMMWLLSQGDNIEVLKPASLRSQMKDKILRMLEKYQINNIAMEMNQEVATCNDENRD